LGDRKALATRDSRRGKKFAVSLYDNSMSLKIAQLGQPVLRQRAVEVSLDEIRSPQFQQFLDDMLATLAEARGAGLAGPQVFAGKRVFLAGVLPPAGEDQQPGVEVFINPQIVSASEERSLAWEGCLSFLELLVLVPRRRRIQVQFLDRRGEMRTLDLEGFAARVVQHEYDHLDGILTLDRAPSTRYIVKASEIDAVLEAEKRSETEPPEPS
jgi:peptide deformylase